MRVYVLGAGASAPDGVPTTKELFKTAILGCGGEIDGQSNHQLISASFFEKPEASRRIRPVLDLFDFLEGTRLAQAFDEHYQGWSRPSWLTVDTSQIEDFFTKLYRMRHGTESYGTYLQPNEIQERSDLANDLLFDTICCTAAIGEESQCYLAFVNKILRHPGPQCIISFNYDVRLDFHLAWLWKRYDRKKGVFLPVDELQWTYGIEFSRAEWRWCERLPQEAKIAYYKLHGSLNMSFNPQTKAVSLHEPCGDHRAHRYSGRESRFGQPLLIPPLLQKEISIPALATLWEKAEETLSQAEEIHVIGYSAPGADEAAKKLLKGIGKRASVKRVVIANKEESDRNRLQALLESKVVRSYTSFEGYLRRECSADVTPGREGASANWKRLGKKKLIDIKFDI